MYILLIYRYTLPNSFHFELKSSSFRGTSSQYRNFFELRLPALNLLNELKYTQWRANYPSLPTPTSHQTDHSQRCGSRLRKEKHGRRRQRYTLPPHSYTSVHAKMNEKIVTCLWSFLPLDMIFFFLLEKKKKKAALDMFTCTPCHSSSTRLNGTDVYMAISCLFLVNWDLYRLLVQLLTICKAGTPGSCIFFSFIY